MTLISTLNSAGRTLFLAAQWLKRDTQAVAAIEAAITIPTLLVAGLGGLEVSNLMITHTRISSIALATADNASRIAASSGLALPQVREIDINDTFRGAQIQSGNLNLQGHGRIILSSLETNPDGGQWIHWQRCYGSKSFSPQYGSQGAGASGTAFPGMGRIGAKVASAAGTPVMFVEVAYDYQPFMFGSFVGNKTIQYDAAYMVRDPRNTSGTGIFNPSPTATPYSSC